jgi:hypothetical protein
VNPSTFPGDYAAYVAAIAQAQQQAPEVGAEPPLKCYVFASCRIKTVAPHGEDEAGIS